MPIDAIPLRPMQLQLNVQQGSTFQLQLQLQDEAGPYSLAGYTAALTLRSSLAAPAPAAIWSTATGELTLDTALGYLNINVDSTATAAFDVANDATDYAFDLVIKNTASPAFRQTLAVGTVRVWRAASRGP